MKKAKWLLELDLFTDTEMNLINTIKKSGREVKTLKYIPFEQDLNYIKKLYNENDCVIFYGSLNLGRKIQRNCSFIPGVYLNERNFECTSYYPKIGDELLHTSYTMMPYGDLLRRKNDMFRLYGDLLFIRPNSGLKEFTGTVLDKNNFEDGIKLAGFYNVEPDLLCVVSNAKNIKKEWRFVIVNNTVISGSLYRDWTISPELLYHNSTTRDIILKNSKSIIEYCTDDKAFKYANKIAKMYNPDNAWTLDVTLTENNEYKVIELGCFSCAGMYGNNLTKIVEKISEDAENEWRNYQNII
jgi:hypothetical protein